MGVSLQSYGDSDVLGDKCLIAVILLALWSHLSASHWLRGSLTGSSARAAAQDQRPPYKVAHIIL